jgi:hypothetical protein
MLMKNGSSLQKRTCAYILHLARMFRVNKDHIIKAMFLCAVAHPCFNPAGECTFDGKIGLFPFVERVRAQCASVNRPQGAPIIRLVPAVTKHRYCDFLVEKVVPAINEKWPDRER